MTSIAHEKRYEVWADITDKCLPDYLTDHHNGENEMLLSFYPTGQSEAEALDELMDSLGMWDGIPEEIEEPQIREALATCLARADNDFFASPDPSEEIEESPEDGASLMDEASDVQCYVVLTWREVAWIQHRVFIEVQIEGEEGDKARQSILARTEALLEHGSIRGAFSDAGLDASNFSVKGLSPGRHSGDVARYVDLAEDTSAMCPNGALEKGCGFTVLLWPNNEPVIWLKNIEGTGGLEIRPGRGPTGLGVTIRRFIGGSSLSVSAGANVGTLRYRGYAKGEREEGVDILGDPLVYLNTDEVDITQHCPPEGKRSQEDWDYVRAFQKWYRGEGRHPAEMAKADAGEEEGSKS